ncbi:MAG: fructose-1,6-bisphosphatase [Peptoniphilaceae bacterium]|nr:fructose-1,6-bisphosphatase [Peptoniphilaceae bacterium]MDY6085233.1 fructose-1,6-bisphosphatase [Peptoniphilaceae bacterium]
MEEKMFLGLLAKRFPNRRAVMGEIMRLKTEMLMPKGTEYFFSDIHGEDQAFIHLLRSASGNIRRKIRDVYRTRLSEADQNEIAALIYYPEATLAKKVEEMKDERWVRKVILELIEVARYIASKYPRATVRAKFPERYRSLIDELFVTDNGEIDRHQYCLSLIDAIIEEGFAADFIGALARTIQRICVNHIHIVGDIFDRGPGPDKIIEELIAFDDVDIQWGNHDVVWMGAQLGNETCMMAVLRNAIKYNTFDVLEDGYGIHLRVLSDFASKYYGDDPCTYFQPKIYDENVYNIWTHERAAQMHKALAILESKLEGQLLERHPEYKMADRVVLKKVDWETMEYVEADGTRYPLRDTHFPTIDPNHPLALSPDEEQLVFNLKASFRHSETLRRHVRFLLMKGSSYSRYNGNLLFHGCLPMREDGSFEDLVIDGKPYAGKELMDYVDYMMTTAYYADPTSKKRQDALDFIWYLWCGPISPMFGKSKMATFENNFVGDKALAKEELNPYYELCNDERVVDRIFEMFDLEKEHAHIVNGHVPVKIKEGQTPMRANGKLFVIDGGIAKSYQAKTGIAGYTLIFNSHHIALAEHQDFDRLTHDLETYSPVVTTMDRYERRVLIADTDEGHANGHLIESLHDLMHAYATGELKESGPDQTTAGWTAFAP